MLYFWGMQMLNKVTGSLLLVVGGIILCFIVIQAPEMENHVWKVLVAIMGVLHIIGGIMNIFKEELNL